MKTLYTFLVLFFGFSVYASASEFYLKVNRAGNFQVSAGGQLQTNSTLMYRFFDLPAGNTQVIVTDLSTNSIVFNNYVMLNTNQRSVAELDNFGTMTVLQNINISVSNWYNTQTVGTVVNNTGGGNVNPTTGSGHGGAIYDPNANASFQQFLTFLDSQSFDSGKLVEAKKYAAAANLSAQQIKDIALKFTFDDSRLDFAKSAYNRCWDKANYFLLKSTFTFSSSYDELQDYIEGL